MDDILKNNKKANNEAKGHPVTFRGVAFNSAAGNPYNETSENEHFLAWQDGYNNVGSNYKDNSTLQMAYEEGDYWRTTDQGGGGDGGFMSGVFNWFNNNEENIDGITGFVEGLVDLGGKTGDAANSWDNNGKTPNSSVKPTDNTKLYVGIGGAVVLIGIVLFLMKTKKPIKK